jgi:hypothetical protein
VAQLREARQIQRRTVMELRRSLAAGTITEEEFRAQREAAHAEFVTAMQEILTDEQLTQLDELRRERMVARLTVKLDKLEDQVTRRVELLRPILELDESQAAALTDLWLGTGPVLETVLTGLQDGSIGVDEARQQLAELRSSTHDAVLEILSEEQAQLLEELRRACHRGGRRGPGL